MSKTTTIQDVKKFIEQATPEELRALNETMRYAYDLSNRRASSRLSLRDKVAFVDKYGGTHKGIITKVNPKTITLREINHDGSLGTNWKVSPQLVKLIVE